MLNIDEVTFSTLQKSDVKALKAFKEHIMEKYDINQDTKIELKEVRLQDFYCSEIFITTAERGPFKNYVTPEGWGYGHFVRSVTKI